MTAHQSSLATSESVDPSQLLRLTSTPARIVLTLFMIANVVYVVASLNAIKNAIPVWLALILVNSAAALLLANRPDPFPLWWSLGIVAAVGVSTALVAFQLPDSGPIGRAAWHLGANAWVLFLLALRRRVALAWVGYVAMAGVTAFWGASVGRGALSGLLELDAQTALLFVGSLFALNLRRTSRRINEIRKELADAAAEEAEAQTSAVIRSRRVNELRTTTGPLLESLAEQGPPADAAGRKVFASAEAQLRDGVRGRSLVNPQIVAATASARERGVDVDLLDDRGAVLASAAAVERMTATVVASLSVASAGTTVTVRLGPAGRPVAVSIVTSTDGATTRVELDADGVVIPVS